jgi:hypothetical protein
MTGVKSKSEISIYDELVLCTQTTMLTSSDTIIQRLAARNGSKVLKANTKALKSETKFHTKQG